MEPRLGIRIEGPEPEFASGPVVAFAVVAMAMNLGTLYLLFVEFFDLPLEPFLGGLMGLG